MKCHITDETKTINVSLATVAGTSTVTSSVVDMQGYDACRFICVTGTATTGTVLTLTAKSNTANSTSSPAPTTETSSTFTSANGTDATEKILITDVIKPGGRYVFATLTRATQNCVMDSLVCELYRSKLKPAVADATVIASSKTVSGGSV